MTLSISIPQHNLLKPRISVFGVGGAGGNAINNMIRANLEGVEFIAANTDAQALSNSLASNRIQLGAGLTKGLGAGSFPDRGRAAAEENVEEIIKYLEGNNMIFITAGMGGGTGTGAAPVIAKLARERDILTVGVVTRPFDFEGKYRMEAAIAGVEELKKHVDTLIIIPNQNLFRIANEQTTFESAFKMADNVLHAGVRGVTDLITMPGLVNLDFADIRTIMTKMGKAMMGTGEAEGENRAINACQEAISNPLLDDISIKGARGVLVNMTGGPDMTLFEADLAVNAIRKEVDANANIIFGSAFNEDMKGKIRISVVATGIDSDFFQSAPSKPIEIRTTNLDQGSNIIVEQNGKSFFDPKFVKNIDQDLQEIRANDFQPSMPVMAQEEPEEEDIFAKEDAKIEEKHEEYKVKINFSENFSKDNFAKEHSLKEDRFENVADKISQFEESLKEKKSAKTKKEGGFSLFNFMNGSSKE
jgi:cell division protein FtsZ